MIYPILYLFVGFIILILVSYKDQEYHPLERWPIIFIWPIGVVLMTYVCIWLGAVRGIEKLCKYEE